MDNNTTTATAKKPLFKFSGFRSKTRLAEGRLSAAKIQINEALLHMNIHGHLRQNPSIDRRKLLVHLDLVERMHAQIASKGKVDSAVYSEAEKLALDVDQICRDITEGLPPLPPPSPEMDDEEPFFRVATVTVRGTPDRDVKVLTLPQLNNTQEAINAMVQGLASLLGQDFIDLSVRELSSIFGPALSISAPWITKSLPKKQLFWFSETQFCTLFPEAPIEES